LIGLFWFEINEFCFETLNHIKPKSCRRLEAIRSNG